MKIILSISFRILVVACACFSGVLSAQTIKDQEPKWGYRGSIGPERWGSLSDKFRLCEVGTHQSPIDFLQAENSRPDPVVPNYKKSAMTVINTGTTIEVRLSGGNHMTVTGKRFDLKQFHFHSPSEHSIAGYHYAMELHFVHQALDGQLAVIGVFLMEENENPALRSVWDHIPPRPGEKISGPDVTLDPAALLPEVTEAYSYLGSLTTPPCTEGVTWYVAYEPVAVSLAQVATFRALFGLNARPPQPFNCRTVTLFPFIRGPGPIW